MSYEEEQWTCDLCPPHEHTAYDGPQAVPSTPFWRAAKDQYLKSVQSTVTVAALAAGVVIGQLISLALLAVVSASI